MECLCCHKRGTKERRNNKECNTYVGEEERVNGSPSKTTRVDRMTVHRTKTQIIISLSTTRAGGVSKGRGRGGGSHSHTRTKQHLQTRKTKEQQRRQEEDAITDPAPGTEKHRKEKPEHPVRRPHEREGNKRDTTKTRSAGGWLRKVGGGG